MPYFIIGEMYEASYNDCVKDNGVDSRLMVQAAIRKWKMAKEIDADVVELVDTKLNQYKNLINTKSTCDNPKMKTVVLETNPFYGIITTMQIEKKFIMFGAN